MLNYRELFSPKLQEALKILTEQHRFNIRTSQEHMMHSILSTLSAEDKNKHVIIEAPTGTGKSLGYLLPLLTSNVDKKIIVTTGMVSLQEQLFYKDIPLLQSILGPFKASLAKGRSRYVCLERLKDEAPHYPLIQHWYNNYQTNTWNGESETLLESDDIKKKFWPIVTVDSKSCKDSACPSYDKCVFHNIKKEWKNSRVIIANHDLLLSDIKFGGGTLGDLSNSIVVIDEGHHFPGKAVHTASLQFSTHMLDDIKNYIDKYLPHYKQDPYYINLETHKKTWNKYWGPYLKKIAQYKPLFIDETMRSVSLDLWKDAAVIVKEWKNIFDGYFKSMKMMPSTLWKDIHELSKLISTMDSFIENATMWEEKFETDKPPIARWIELAGQNYVGVQEPTMAGDWLAKKFFSQTFMTVITSATLRSVGGFNWYKERAGLRRFKPSELALDSPFNYASQGTFHVVHNNINVNAPDYTTYVANCCNQLLSHGCLGHLVLFTSKKIMDDVFAIVEKQHPYILKQYTSPNQFLIKQHKQKIDSGEKSILMGTMSFMEGLDLPGHYCEQVILTKLPFSSCDSPGERVLSEWLEVNGRNPFREMVLPEAGVNYIQACGRLIRRESDSGRFVLLDDRVITKAQAYGNNLIKLTPNFKRLDWSYKFDKINM